MEGSLFFMSEVSLPKPITVHETDKSDLCGNPQGQHLLASEGKSYLWSSRFFCNANIGEHLQMIHKKNRILSIPHPSQMTY